jgi:hypothetical protein
MFPEVVQAHKDRLIAMAHDQSPSGFLLDLPEPSLREGRKTDVFRISELTNTWDDQDSFSRRLLSEPEREIKLRIVPT